MSGARALTEKQRSFVVAYTSEPGALGNASAAARAAGYSEKTARVIGWQLLATPHVREAINEANRDQLSGRIATKAVALLERVIDDESVPMRDRVAAAKTVLDRGGFMPPSVTERARDVMSKKPLNELTREELAAYVAAERQAIAELERAAEKGPDMIDVTPNSGWDYAERPDEAAAEVEAAILIERAA